MMNNKAIDREAFKRVAKRLAEYGVDIYAGWQFGLTSSDGNIRESRYGVAQVPELAHRMERETPRGGPRYLMPASVQPSRVQPARIRLTKASVPARETPYTVDDCALLAAMIAQRLQPTGNGAELVAPVREGVLAVFDAATKRVTSARCDEVLRDACGVLVTVLSLAESDRVPIASAIVRELLTDGDDAAEVLDRAMRDACDRRRDVTDDHRAKAAAILATFITREVL